MVDFFILMFKFYLGFNGMDEVFFKCKIYVGLVTDFGDAFRILNVM